MRVGARLPQWLSAGLVVGVASAALADAPPDQYGFFDQESAVIFDSETLLTWERRPPSALLDQPDAANRCATLSLDAGVPSGTWRLPSYKELETLVDEFPHTEYPDGGPTPVYIDGNAFLGTPVDVAFWSSSISPASPGKAYAVSFMNGQAEVDGTDNTQLHSRCVVSK